MELFTIQCTTCKARLVVKDESVIGDILSCPKCNSMVQVVPPVGWKQPGAGDSSPGELPAVEPAVSAPVADVEKTVAAQPSTPEPAKKKAAAAAAAAIPPALPPRPNPQPAESAEPAPSEPMPTEAGTTFEPATPETGTTLLATAVAWAKRDWIMLSSGLAGGVALGAVVWLVVAISSSQPVEVTQATAPDNSVEPTASDQPSEPTQEKPAAEEPDLPQPTTTADATPDRPPVVAKATLPAEVDLTKPAADETSEPAAPPPVAATTTDAVEDTGAQESSPSLKLDPIRPTNSPLPVDLAAVVPSAGDARPREPVPVDPQPASDAVEPPSKPAALSAEQINERLAVSLASVEFADVPLAQFAAFIADVSGVPVTFDDASLAKSPPGRNSPISVQLRQTTAGDALRAAVKQAGLSVSVRDGQLVVAGGRE